MSQVVERAIRTLLAKVARSKLGAAANPRGPRRRTNSPRHIPSDVKRAVWERDGGQCTFIGEDGHRCEARDFLEFDHVVPVARGGQATVEGLRVLCGPHNQLVAERAFGREFMEEKRKR